MLSLQKDDLQRTVGINTYYLGTMDFKMEPGDKALLVEVKYRLSTYYTAAEFYIELGMLVWGQLFHTGSHYHFRK